MKTEFEFTLPRGYLAPDGKVYRDGVMRLAVAGDEIEPLDDPRVKANRAFLVVLLLARVIVRLGDLTGDEVTPAVIERLFSADLAYLRDVYRRINGIEEPEGPAGPGPDTRREVTCPQCGEKFEVDGV